MPNKCLSCRNIYENYFRQCYICRENRKIEAKYSASVCKNLFKIIISSYRKVMNLCKLKFFSLNKLFDILDITLIRKLLK
jgi:hypothetical protein